MAQRGQRVVWKDPKSKDVSQFADTGTLQDAIKKEDWNDYHVVVQGRQLQALHQWQVDV